MRFDNNLQCYNYYIWCDTQFSIDPMFFSSMPGVFIITINVPINYRRKLGTSRSPNDAFPPWGGGGWGGWGVIFVRLQK